MKKIKIKSKLNLIKEQIANLNEIRGGGDDNPISKRYSWCIFCKADD